MSDRPKVRIADIATAKGLAGGPFGSSLGTKDYAPAGVPVIRGVNLATDGRFNDKEFVYVTPEKAGALSRNIARPGDVVFTQRGTLGQVGIVPPSPPAEYIISQSQMRLRVRPELAMPEFIYYQFKSPEMISTIHNLAITTGVPHINLGILANLQIDLPSLGEQQAICQLLGSLDDKIAINDRIATTARKLGQAKFAEALQEPGRREAQVSEVVGALTRGVAPKYSTDDSAVTVVNQKCVRNGRVNLEPARKTLQHKLPASKLLMQNDVLINSTGVGTLGRVARWTHNLRATVDSHITIVRFDPQKVDPVCAGFAALNAQPDFEALGEGSTGQTELNRKRLGTFRITLPSAEAMRRLRPELDSLESRADAAIEESTILGKLRDTLLPKLMSGEIRVRDAEKVVEEAT